MRLIIFGIIGFIIVLLALLANGFIAEVEDNSPGGLNNPEGKWIDVIRNPKPHQVIIWGVGIVMLLGLISLFIFK